MSDAGKTREQLLEELATLRQASGLLHAIINGITDPIFVKDRTGHYLLINAAAARLLGQSPAEVVGQSPTALFTPETAEQIVAGDQRAIASGQSQTYEEEIEIAGARRSFLTTRAPYRDAGGEVQGVLGIARDITEHKQAQGLLEVQRQVLERLSTDAPLSEVLEVLAGAIEAQAQDMLCSILLLDEDGTTLRHGAAPSLPADYCHTIDGAKIGPRVGSCGTAAYLGKPVIVTDIASDPLWADYRHLALPYGLRACWSTPIKSATGKGLGTFAVYYRTPRGPEAYELRLVEVSTHLAALAIERRRAQDALRESQGRFEAFMDDSPAVAWMKDEELRFVYVNRTWEQRFQRSLAEIRGRTDLDIRPTEVGERLRQHDRDVLAAGNAKVFEEMVPNPDGRPRYWQVYKFPFTDAAGKRYVGGVAVDVTERKEAEARRLAYAERLEELSRRVLEAQEEERRHLARELHDEFGQLLTGINLNLRAIRARLAAEARPGVEDSINAVTEAIRQTRNFSLDLRPPVLDDFGLVPALRWYVERLSGRAELVVELETDLPGGRLPTHIETACFRIAQEALTNVLRHARARRVRVEAKQHGPRVYLSIRDDGVGFVVPSVTGEGAHTEGFGLLGMQDRARLVGGQMAVESAPGLGTLIRVEIPVAAAPASGGNEAKETHNRS